MIKERDQYFDFLRGIAIIFVIGIHTLVGTNFDNIIGCTYVLIRQILNSAVPLFLAISGFFLARKGFSDSRTFLFFLFNQSKKIYIPTLLWSLPWLALAIYRGNNPIINILAYFLCGMSVYYFIALIIQYYALLPFIKRLTNNWGG